jgi:hypothetical protein
MSLDIETGCSGTIEKGGDDRFFHALRPANNETGAILESI